MLDLAIDSRIVLNTELECAIQELDLLFNTQNTELIGYSEFGTNFEQFLWQLNPSINELKKYIMEKISTTYFLSKMKVDLDISIVSGLYRNIYLVQINVKDNSDETVTRVYQFK